MSNGSVRVLLIGGSGFLGHHTARALLEAGHRVTVLSRGRQPVPEGAEHLLAHREEPASLAAALESQRFDLTVDFQVFRARDIESLLLVPYATLGRYVMISTGQVYLVTEGARPPYREEDSEGPIVEEPPRDAPEHAGWSYGTAKRRAERMLMGLRASHGVRAVILRLPILQGEGDGSLRLWAYVERLLDGGPIVLPEGGTQATRHLDANDVARAIVWLVENPPPRAGFYNLAQPDVVTLRELLGRMAQILEVNPQYADASWSEIAAAGIDRSFSPYAGRWCSVLDPARVAGEWGFFGTRLDEYLPRVIRWHLAHRPPSHAGYEQRPRELELAARVDVR